MSIKVKNTIMKGIDIVEDERGSVTLQTVFSSDTGVNGTGRQPNAKMISNICSIAGTNSLKNIKNIPVRIVFSKEILVAIGSYNEDKWCYLPAGGALFTLEDIRKAENESDFLWNY